MEKPLSCGHFGSRMSEIGPWIWKLWAKFKSQWTAKCPRERKKETSLKSINTPNVVHSPRVWLFPFPLVTEISSINSWFSPCFDTDRSICGYLKVHFQCDMKVSSAVISLRCLPYSVQRSETATFYARQLRKIRWKVMHFTCIANYWC